VGADNLVLGRVSRIARQLLVNPFPFDAFIVAPAFTARIISDAQVGVLSSVLAAANIDEISTAIILRLPRLALFTLTSPNDPQSFRLNLRLYAERILAVLQNHNNLVGVVLPLEFGRWNVSLIRALRALPRLALLEFRLPTTFAPTQQQIHRFQTLLAIHLRRFNQIEVITLPIQLVSVQVLHALAPLQHLEVMVIISPGGRGGDAFAWILRESSIEQSHVIFPVLRMVNVNLAGVPAAWKLSTIAMIVNRLFRVLVV